MFDSAWWTVVIIPVVLGFLTNLLSSWVYDGITSRRTDSTAPAPPRMPPPPRPARPKAAKSDTDEDDEWLQQYGPLLGIAIACAAGLYWWEAIPLIAAAPLVLAGIAAGISLARFPGNIGEWSRRYWLVLTPVVIAAIGVAIAIYLAPNAPVGTGTLTDYTTAADDSLPDTISKLIDTGALGPALAVIGSVLLLVYVLAMTVFNLVVELIADHRWLAGKDSPAWMQDRGSVAVLIAAALFAALLVWLAAGGANTFFTSTTTLGQ